MDLYYIFTSVYATMLSCLLVHSAEVFSFQDLFNTASQSDRVVEVVFVSLITVPHYLNVCGILKFVFCV